MTAIEIPYPTLLAAFAAGWFAELAEGVRDE